MYRDIVCQISMFGDFTSIKPDPETVQSMLTKFSDYGLLPSIFQEGNFTLSPNPQLSKTKTTNRLQMVSLEKKINVMFASNRIDVNRTSTDLNSGVTNDDINELLDILGKAVSGLSATRIGFNTTSLLDNPSASLLQKIQPSLDFYSDPNELVLRANKRKDITFGEGSSEKSNVILTAQKTMGNLLINNQQIPVENGLILQFDINTIPENTDPRFFSANTKEYVVAANQLRNAILGNLVS